MYYTYAITGLTLIISLIVNREKTLKAVKIAITKFTKIFPAFLTMLIFVSFILFLFPDEVISNYLGHSSKSISVFLASLFGSITIMPGFIAFPLSGILLTKGVPYMVLSAFTTTLMMVGILTYPIEKEYFGTKVTIIRNIISFFIALSVAAMTGIFFREIF
ncbi:MAG: permease [Candidatus Caldatribacteriota bacterium]|nr:permease [Candidatus Caldatribacteriota bacterium]